MSKDINQNEEKFIDKAKKGLVKFFNGVKSFIVKTGRKNSTNYYGRIENIGDFIVYDDHALISAVGMDDVVFTNNNVISYSFEGLGPIIMKKATVKYKIVLDDTVVFPEMVRQKNDVKNLNASILVEKERSYFLGQGQMEYGQGNRGLTPLENCDVYGYQNCFVIVLKLEKRVGDKVERYQESILYPFTDISAFEEKKGKLLTFNFKGEKIMQFTPKNEEAYEFVKKIVENK